MAKMDLISSPVLALKMSKEDFDPDKYVKDMCGNCNTHAELKEQQKKIKTLNEETAATLKRNVYRNYQQFIETSREISYLEAEMYQLSHLLTDQKSNLSTQLEMSLFGRSESSVSMDISDGGPPSESDSYNETMSLLENIDGLSSVMDVHDHHCLMEGDLLEIDQDSLGAVERVKGFLLDDFLVITMFVSNKLGPGRFKLKSVFEVDNVGVVNVHDMEGLRDAFRIMNFPTGETVTFQAEDSETKAKWLSMLEETRQRFKLQLQKEVSAQSQMTQEHYDKDKNPFYESDEDDNDSIFTNESSTHTVLSKSDLLAVEWLRDIPDDLDVCIAQRDFEGAMTLIEKVNDYLKDSPSSHALNEVRSRVDHRVKLLSEALMTELEANQSILLHGGPQSSRRAVLLLNKLGKAHQACTLFLRNRSEAMKQSFRHLKIEGATALYITKLSNVFFTSLVECHKEFCKLFSECKGFKSAFIVWANDELEYFVSKLSRQVFHCDITLSAIGICVGIATRHCNKLQENGLDLTFSMKKMLMENIKDAIYESHRHHVEAIKHRVVEEQWQAVDYTYRHDELDALIYEMESMGIVTFNTVVVFQAEQRSVRLSNSTITFIKSACGFLYDCLQLYSSDLHHDIIHCLHNLFETQVSLFRSKIKSGHNIKQADFIFENATFILDTVLPVVEDTLKNRLHYVPDKIQSLHSEMAKLSTLAGNLDKN
ncbi:exocyst complex component 8-like [Dendronephthya gigantea]|uniref:exocyst complex component 8-like n=1 Tax=Dendronephthya gigantea TaxID=151771 RepID=UPI00106A29C7|nr:exocyst complex component 8-like [Dendronephthya gigantea]